jgi:hypothetical protein
VVAVQRLHHPDGPDADEVPDRRRHRGLAAVLLHARRSGGADEHLSGADIAALLGAQAAWAVLCVAGGLWAWRKGVRHFEAVGN